MRIAGAEMPLGVRRVTWQRVRLDAVRKAVPYAFVGGPFGSKLTTRDYCDEGVPVIRGNNLPGDAPFLDGQFAFVSEQKADELVANIAYPGDLVFTQRGTLGQVGIVPIQARFPRYVVSQSQMKLTVDRSIADARFIYQFFRLPNTIQAVTARALTSGVPHINLGILKAFEVPLPPLRVQREIAEVAASFDGLLANNTRRMELLGQAAQELFREWFVRFRFPRREHVQFSNTRLGRLPVGWKVTSLDTITTKIGSGATPRGGEAAYHSSGIALIRSQNVYDNGFVDDGLAFLDDEQAADLVGVTVQARDILLNITGASVARCCMVPSRHLPARVNQHVMIIRVDPAQADSGFVLHAINSHERKQQLLSYARAGGATREALTKTTVGSFEVVLPNAALLRQFSEVVGDMMRQTELLAEQNIKLRTARDLLLPRLMSGEIAV